MGIVVGQRVSLFTMYERQEGGKGVEGSAAEGSLNYRSNNEGMRVKLWSRHI